MKDGDVLTRIGKPAAAGDAADLLLECHERIRTFLALGGRVAAADPRDPGLAEAAGRVRRYFAEALPLHARDEDESIAPRLRGRDAAVDRELAAMAREHREHEAPIAVLVDACERIAGAPAALPDLAARLAQAVSELERHFVAHLDREEAIVFPAMRRLLDPAEDGAVVREMRARRTGTP